MERKRIIAIGIEGSATPNLPPGEGALWIPGVGGKGTILFGLPDRSEDDAERALRTATMNLESAFRQSIKEIVIEVDGTDIRFSWNEIFSNDLRSLQNGEATIAPSLAKIFDRLFLFEKADENGNEFFLLRGERGRPSRLRGLHPTHASLVGREREIKRLEELLDQVAVDQGQISGIVGEAGIGKTRLLVALKELLLRKSIPFAEGTFHVREGHRPYVGFAEIVSKLVGGKIETLSRWEMTDVETDFLRLFLEPGTKIERLAGLSENDIREGLFQAVRRLIQTAAKQPLVIILEDLHWADAGSIDLLERVMEGMESTRLLIVLAHRPDLAIHWKKRLNYNEITLKPFSSEEVENFLATSTGVDRVAARVRNDLFTLSIGNPLFAEEILRQFLDSGALEIEKGDDGKKILRAKETKLGNVPATLHSLIAARFDRLDPALREILRWASLLGSTIEAPELEQIAAKENSAFDKKTMTELFEKGYLVEQSVFPRKIYRFQHDLILDVVREGLSESETKRRHGAIAAVLAARYEDQIDFFLDRIADHSLESNDDLDAIRWSKLAADRNMAIFNYSLAERYYRAAAGRSLSKIGKPSDVESLFAPWIRALLSLGKYDEALDALHKWHNAVSAAAKGNYHLISAEIYRARSEYEKSLEAADAAIKEFQSSHHEKERLDAIQHRLHALTFLGRSKEVIHEGLQTLHELGDRYPDIRFRIWGRISYQAISQGELDQGLDYLHKADAIKDPGILPADQIDFHMRTLSVYEQSLDYESSLSHLDQASHIAKTHGMRGRFAWILSDKGVTHSGMGQYAKALAELSEVKSEAAQLKDHYLEITSQIEYADCLVQLGQFSAAQVLIDETESQYGERFTIWKRAHAIMLRSMIAMAKSNYTAAATFLQTAIQIYEKAGSSTIAHQRLTRLLVLQANAGLRNSNELASSYNELIKLTEAEKTLLTQLSNWVAQLTIAAVGGEIKPPLVDKFHPKDIAYFPMKQRSYLALIRYFSAKGTKKEAEALANEYRKFRKDALKNIPPEFHESFLRHPEYSPEANGF